MADQANEQQTTQTETTQNNQQNVDETAILRQKLQQYEKENKEFRQTLKKQEDEKLRSNQEWQKLSEMKEKEASEWREKHDSLATSLITREKYSALLKEATKMGLREEAVQDLDLVDLSEISIETTSTGRYNILGADKYAQKLKSLRPHWFGSSTPNVNTSTMRVDQIDQVTPAMIRQAEKEGKKSGDMTRYYELNKKYRAQK